MTQTVAMTVNGRAVTVTVDDPQMPLLYALRNDVGVGGPHYGCGLGQCGACTIHLNGEAARSCQIPVTEAAGKTIVTLDGLGTPERPHPVQAAFIAEQAVQCGYCANGMIMESAALLAKTPRPTEAQVKEALANNICRCGTHPRVVAAVLRAARG
ncbi:(2Fe-2S)-binding protein [Roseomonas sp. PWR1]|uniref:(2Fe-2S)-binding protein n=1 Tax=Roseomonas nitratireducens TaxID=2820810 RepID=A0ABS4AWG4_9PROT|nr:(2Fe-2S)-binding protein [Neoroseomonas nitratireducens]MBP0465622.1 (2Fe-2S)-binding protein [Neoroseomonas nitratireducens]